MDQSQKRISDFKENALRIEKKVKKLHPIIVDPSISNKIIYDSFGYNFNSLNKITDGFLERSEAIDENVAELRNLGITGMSLANISSSTVQIAAKYGDDPHFRDIINRMNEPTIYDEKDKIALTLREIDPELKKKYNTIWQLNRDPTKDFLINLPTHEIREVISHFLQKLAPDNEVRLQPWCHEHNGKPTHITRAIYAIIGNQPDIDLKINGKGAHSTDKKILHIIDVAKRFRDLYNKSSEFSHIRGKQITSEIKKDVEICMSQLNESIREISELRKINFQK